MFTEKQKEGLKAAALVLIEGKEYEAVQEAYRVLQPCDDHIHHEPLFCALGVLLDVVIKRPDNKMHWSGEPGWEDAVTRGVWGQRLDHDDIIRQEYGLSNSTQQAIARINDDAPSPEEGHKKAGEEILRLISEEN